MISLILNSLKSGRSGWTIPKLLLPRYFNYCPCNYPVRAVELICFKIDILSRQWPCLCRHRYQRPNSRSQPPRPIILMRRRWSTERPFRGRDLYFLAPILWRLVRCRQDSSLGSQKTAARERGLPNGQIRTYHCAEGFVNDQKTPELAISNTRQDTGSPATRLGK